jgi:hypothetical protein
VISPSQRPLSAQNTAKPKEEYPCTQRIRNFDSNNQTVQTYALHGAVTGIGRKRVIRNIIYIK